MDSEERRLLANLFIFFADDVLNEEETSELSIILTQLQRINEVDDVKELVDAHYRILCALHSLVMDKTGKILANIRHRESAKTRGDVIRAQGGT